MLNVVSWTELELHKLITAGQEENLQLDFKRTVSTDDRAKTELSKDVSAFANAIGGHVIIGIDEDPDPPHKAKELTGIDPESVSKEWLEQVITSRVRMPGIEVHKVMTCW